MRGSSRRRRPEPAQAAAPAAPSAIPRRAVNFTDGRRLVTLVTPDVGAGPVNIVVRDLTPFSSSFDSSPGRTQPNPP